MSLFALPFFQRQGRSRPDLGLGTCQEYRPAVALKGLDAGRLGVSRELGPQTKLHKGTTEEVEVVSRIVQQYTQQYDGVVMLQTHLQPPAGP